MPLLDCDQHIVIYFKLPEYISLFKSPCLLWTYVCICVQRRNVTLSNYSVCFVSHHDQSYIYIFAIVSVSCFQNLSFIRGISSFLGSYGTVAAVYFQFIFQTKVFFSEIASHNTCQSFSNSLIWFDFQIMGWGISALLLHSLFSWQVTLFVKSYTPFCSLNITL